MRNERRKRKGAQSANPGSHIVSAGFRKHSRHANGIHLVRGEVGIVREAAKEWDQEPEFIHTFGQIDVAKWVGDWELYTSFHRTGRNDSIRGDLNVRLVGAITENGDHRALLSQGNLLMSPTAAEGAAGRGAVSALLISGIDVSSSPSRRKNDAGGNATLIRASTAGQALDYNRPRRVIHERELSSAGPHRYSSEKGWSSVAGKRIRREQEAVGVRAAAQVISMTPSGVDRTAYARRRKDPPGDSSFVAMRPEDCILLP